MLMKPAVQDGKRTRPACSALLDSGHHTFAIDAQKWNNIDQMMQCNGEMPANFDGYVYHLGICPDGDYPC